VKRLDDPSDEWTPVGSREKGLRRAHSFRITGRQNDSRKHTSV
jgi:hypothetical protein